jgi:hypothetical protein
MGFAQGVYYWSQNYGTVSNLLGGQVIGSVRDVTATYYNPGYLGLVEEPELILGAKIFEYNDYKIDFDFIEDDEVSSGKLTASAGFFAGSFHADSISTHKFFYSYLIREKSDLRFDYKNIQNNPIENEYDTIVNEIFSLRKLSEIWVGVSWAFAPKKHVGLGLTPYVAIRSDELRFSNTLSSEHMTDIISTTRQQYQYDFYNVRLLAKFGMIWQLSPLTLGFNLTTPSINLFGSGFSYINLTKSARILEDSSLDNGVLIADYQENLNSYYKNSVNLGVGLSYEFGKSRFHLSAEWFNSVPEFSVLDPDPFIAQSTGDTLQNTVSVSLKSVINYGIGYEQTLSDVISAFGSVFIDHNASNNSRRPDVFDIDMPIYHLTAGANIRIGTTYLTTGLEFAYGSHKFESNNSIGDIGSQEGDENSVLKLDGQQKYFKIKLIISAAFKL